MAVDELLLESASERAISTLRWYRWSEPTVSLGYFQPRVPEELADRFRGLPVVRRLSGGGAILHDQELTYAIALAGNHPLAANPRELYDLAHHTAISVLGEFGITAALRGDSHPERGGNFLCFSRGDSFDVVCQGEKVLGSAQRRRKRAVLQHGSLLLRRSQHAPEFRGVCDFASAPVDVDRLESRLNEAFSRFCGAGAGNSPIFDGWRAGELERLAELEQGKVVEPC